MLLPMGFCYKMLLTGGGQSETTRKQPSVYNGCKKIKDGFIWEG